jgi:hypothetical protein
MLRAILDYYHDVYLYMIERYGEKTASRMELYFRVFLRLCMVFLFYIVGVLFYHHMEGFNIDDAAYFVTVTITTGMFHHEIEIFTYASTLSSWLWIFPSNFTAITYVYSVLCIPWHRFGCERRKRVIALFHHHISKSILGSITSSECSKGYRLPRTVSCNSSFICFIIIECL